MSNKANINQTTLTPDGLPITQTLEVDSNRLSIHDETLFRWSNALAIPSRGAYTDAVLWVLTVAVPIRLLDSFALAGAFTPMLSMSLGAVLIAVPTVLTWQCWQARKHTRIAIVYRLLLVAVGLAISFWGLL